MPPSCEAQWIWTDACSGENLYAFFRREFSTSGGTLRVDISSDSFYSLYLDGDWIGRGPARAPLSSYLFDRFDLEVGPGKHCLAVVGHHVGKVNASIMTGRPGLFVSAVMQDAGGSQPWGSGSDWRCLDACAWKRDLPDLMSHFGFWEERDERLMPQGWAYVGFDDSSWSNARVIEEPSERPWQNLQKRPFPLPDYRWFEPAPTMTTGSWTADLESEFPSKTVSARIRQAAPQTASLPWSGGTSGDGAWLVVDFEQCLSGYVELDFLESVPGQCLEISYDDLLTRSGFINPERSYAHLTDRFILPGGACRIRTTHPRGFRYVMLDLDHADRARLIRLSAIDETYPFELRQYSFGDEQLNRIYEKAAQTLRVCTTDAFADCASRERVQWTQDLYLANRVAFHAFGDTAMMRNALFQAAQCALPDGRINGFFPSERTNCAFASSSLLWLHQVVDYWEFTANRDIAELLPTAQRLLSLLSQLGGPNGLIMSWPAGQFWDWAPLEDSGCLLITNAVFLRALDRLRQHAVFRDGLDFAVLPPAETLKRAAHETFWVSSRGLYRNKAREDESPTYFSQQANTMAVWSGICPDENAPHLLRKIVDPELLGPVPVGEAQLDPANPPDPEKLVPFGTLWFAHFLCEAMFERRLENEAIAQILFHWGPYDHLPNYPETRIQNGNTTLCHAWAAGPAYLLPRFLTRKQSTSPSS